MIAQPSASLLCFVLTASAPAITARREVKGRWRNAAAVGLLGLFNLIYKLARYEQVVRLKLLPRNAA